MSDKNCVPDATTLIRELVALPGPPGKEEVIRDAVATHVDRLGYKSEVDPKGNLIVKCGKDSSSKLMSVVVTAHLDEIALMVSRVDPDGSLHVVPLGGLLPFKWGEQPVEVLCTKGMISGVISFGCIHTESPAATTQQARIGPLTWNQATIFTGLSARDLSLRGVRPGTRIALARERRGVLEFGEFIGSYFLDDRADLASWLLALQLIRDQLPDLDLVFAATVSEEVGGEGAAYLMHQLRPEICVALEIGPTVPEGRFMPDDQPTVWVHDNYADTSAHDLELIAELCEELELRPHWQALSLGGSDASSASSRGLTARPITFGLPVENSHGFEIMHRDAPAQLARLLMAFLQKVSE